MLLSQNSLSEVLSFAKKNRKSSTLGNFIAIFSLQSHFVVDMYEKGVMYPDSDAIMVTLARALKTRVENLSRLRPPTTC